MDKQKLLLIGGLVIVGILAFLLIPGGDTPAPSPTPTPAPSPDSSSSTRQGDDTASVVEAPDEPSVAPGYESFSGLNGTWSGIWNNTTFGSTGDIVMTVTVQPDGTASMMMDVGGFVFGLLDPDAVELQGTYSAQEMNIQGSSDVFGPITGKIDADGNVSMSAPSVASPGIAALTVSGVIDEESKTLVGSYVVTFDGGSTAEGTIGF